MDKTKIVEVADQRWQIGRLTPLDGSYIWQRLMAASFRAQMEMVGAQQPEGDQAIAAEAAMAKATPEDRLRTLCGVAFMHMTYDDLALAQRKAMAVVARMEQLAGQPEQPMPVQASDGRWAVAELETDPFLVTRLTVEVLAYNLASFLAKTGPPMSQTT
jgi:hypothetical protein